MKKSELKRPPVDEILTPKRPDMHPDINELLTALKKKMDERYRKKGMNDFGYDTAVLDALANLLIKGGWQKGGAEKGQEDHSDPRLFVKESTCDTCGGEGWYTDMDKKGDPVQVQCSACGKGNVWDAEQDQHDYDVTTGEEDGTRTGEKVKEVQAVSYNGGLPDEEPCKMCGKTPCKCMNLTEIIKKMV